MVVDENFAEEILHVCIAARGLGKYASDCRGQRIHSARRKFRFGNGRKKIFAVLSQAVWASVEKLTTPPEITVTADDCLDAAHKWVEEKIRQSGKCDDVTVLNMASRRNPGGGVRTGAGAQEDYLFRCSDYYKFLYRYAPYAEQYGVTRSHYQYPLGGNFGGIFSRDVTIFRENESTGYRLTPKPWKVNMIAVAGMNSPHLEQVFIKVKSDIMSAL